MQIKIATDFTSAPGPRYVTEGPFSGELFRKTILLPKVKQALKDNRPLTVDLDGTSGYGTSFLEESFGGLIREDKLTLSELKSVLRIVSTEEPDLLDEIKEDMDEAEQLRPPTKGGNP